MEWPPLPSSPFIANYCASPQKTSNNFPVIMLLPKASFFVNSDRGVVSAL